MPELSLAALKRYFQPVIDAASTPPQAPGADYPERGLAALGRGLAQTVATPGRLAAPNPWPEGSEQWHWYEDTKTRDATAWAPEMALNLVGTGMPFAQKGAAGIFGGRLAQTADKVALAQAEKLSASGAPREQIWNDTGWFKGADDKWRFEIPDNITHWKGDPQRLLGSETVMGEAFYHPELYKSYPEMYGIDLQKGIFGPSTKGSYQSGGTFDSPTISLASGKPDSMRSSNLHELQHGIQDIEGFATGGNTIGLRPGTPAWGIYQERLKAIRQPASKADLEASGVIGPEYTYEEYLKQHKAAIKDPVSAARLDRAAQDTAVRQGYERLAGEVEARNVQRRRDMTPEELRAKPPWETQDYADTEQFVKFRDR